MGTETIGITWLTLIGYVLIFFFMTYPITLVLCVIGKVEVNKLSKIKVFNILSTSITIFIEQIKIILVGYVVTAAASFMLFIICMFIAGALSVLGIINPPVDLISEPVIVSAIMLHIITQIVLYIIFIKNYIVEKESIEGHKMPNVATEQNKKIDFWSQSKMDNYLENKKSNTSTLNHEVLSDIGTPIEQRIKDESTKQQNKAIQDLLISANNKTPEVDFKGTGILWIKGRSIPEDASSFYYEIERWVDEYCLNPATETSINIMLEYFNDGGYKHILRILRKLEEIKEIGNSVDINWYYDEVDKDMKDLIEMFSESLHTTINIIPTEEGNGF